MQSRSNNVLPFLLLIAGVLFSTGIAKATSFIPPLRSGFIRSKFGNRKNPFGEGTEFHTGIDIAAPQGTNVYSIAPGRVVSSYSTPIGGKQLVILHDNGWKSGYAHLYFPLVKIGEKIIKGQIIAQSGQSGKVTGSHLHFSLKDAQGRYVNPEKHIKFK